MTYHTGDRHAIGRAPSWSWQGVSMYVLKPALYQALRTAVEVVLLDVDAVYGSTRDRYVLVGDVGNVPVGAGLEQSQLVDISLWYCMAPCLHWS